MRRKRHFIGRNHVLAGALADLRHVDTLGADDRTLTTERTGVHGLVERVVAHYYLSVVIYLPRQQTGVFFIVLEIGAGLHALVAAALYTALGLLNGLLARVALRAALDTVQRADIVKACV